MCNRDIEKSICREMSGDLEKGMLAVGMCHLSEFIPAILLQLAQMASGTPAKDVLISNNSNSLLFMLKLSVKSFVISKVGHLIHLKMTDEALLFQASAEFKFHMLKWGENY